MQEQYLLYEKSTSELANLLTAESNICHDDSVSLYLYIIIIDGNEMAEDLR